MEKKYKELFVAGAAVLVLVCAVAIIGVQAQTAGYHLLKKVHVGGKANWDYFGVDSNSHRVFIPRGKQMTVVDQDGKITDIDIPSGAHGVDFAPEFRRGFTAGGGKVTIFDLDTLKVTNTVDIQGRDTDFIVYDPGSKRFLTMNPDAKDASAVDAETGKFVGQIALGGELEAAQPDGTGHVYAALIKTNEVVEFDAKALKVISTWPIAPCKTPHGMAIDAVHRRLFIGCRNTNTIAVADYVNHKVVASVPIGNGMDSNQFDPGTGLVFSSNGDGTMTIVHEDSPDKYTVVQTLETQKGGRTMALDTKNHNVYIVAADFADKDYPGYMVPPPPGTPRKGPPAFVPDTFTLLSYGEYRKEVG